MSEHAEKIRKAEVVKQPDVVAQVPQVDPVVQKVMELVMEAYNLSTELALIEDPEILKLPVIQSAKKVVLKIKELRELQQKMAPR